MNIYSIMGYSLNFPKSFEYDKNNLPYVKLDADLNNGKTRIDLTFSPIAS